MKDHPLVSIIVPVCNAAPHLERCVQSLTNQTYQNIEILLIDDGSPDGSGEICDVFEERDHQVRAVHSENVGISHARNLGIKASKNQFIQFMDADDYVDNNMSALLVEAHIAEDADLVITGYFEIDAASGQQQRFGLEDQRAMNREQFMDTFTSRRKSKMINSCWNKLYRSSLLAAKDLEFSEGLDMAEKALFNLEYMRESSCIVTLDAKPYFYVRHASGENLTGRFHPNMYAIAMNQLQATRGLYASVGADPSEEEKNHALYVATQLAPYFSKHLGARDCRAYLRTATEMRRDDCYLQHHAALRDLGGRDRALLILFHFSRFEVIYLLGLTSRLLGLLSSHLASSKAADGKKWAKSE